jgi:hypothetical protein
VLVSAGRLFAMKKSRNEKKMEAKNVAKALAEVPIDNIRNGTGYALSLGKNTLNLSPLD